MLGDDEPIDQASLRALPGGDARGLGGGRRAADADDVARAGTGTGADRRGRGRVAGAPRRGGRAARADRRAGARRGLTTAPSSPSISTTRPSATVAIQWIARRDAAAVGARQVRLAGDGEPAVVELADAREVGQDLDDLVAGAQVGEARVERVVPAPGRRRPTRGSRTPGR